MPGGATLTSNLKARSMGRSFDVDQSVTSDNAAVFDPSGGIGPAKTGSLTTRTDNTSGTLTMAASHGITTAAVVDIYWAGGSRRGVTVGTVATNSVPFSGGAGDNLPIATTAVTVMVVHTEVVALTGNNVVGIMLYAELGGTFAFVTSAPAELFAVVLDPGESYVWTSTNGVTNPLAGVTPAAVRMTSLDPAAASRMYGVVHHN